jgi:hypothetical protein
MSFSALLAELGPADWLAAQIHEQIKRGRPLSRRRKIKLSRVRRYSDTE